jgi:serine/threonine protein kinase
MALESGSTLGHYEIVTCLGVGGMGEVYRARDVTLGREVAVKVLLDAMSRSETRARFETEARLLASLNHPNIATLFAFESIGGTSFLAMELVEGETLADQIARGPLSVPEALSVFRQIAQGLAAAHAKGVVHRDLKPANIKVGPRRAAVDSAASAGEESDWGTVKILDFGLAKATAGLHLEASGSDSVSPTLAVGATQEGQILGTVAYMSPEQTRGQLVDGRTDIWSFGVCLYEALLGRLPFAGNTPADLFSSILRDLPEPPSGLRADLPKPLDEIVLRCLEKDRERRFPSASHLLEALTACANRSAPGPPDPRPKESGDRTSIAVLPFTNMSSDPDNEYFSDGLTEEIITDLSKVKAIRVVPRTSIMQLKGTDKSLATISTELGVRYLLEGSVRKAGERLRISAQLLDAEEDTHLWAEKYGGTLDDIFDIQERVSREIVGALKVELTPDDDRAFTSRPIDDVTAYDYYLRAKHAAYSFTEEGTNHAVDLLRRALEIVGDNVLLYSALGFAYGVNVDSGVRPELHERYLERAGECAAKLFELAPDSAEAYCLRSQIAFFRRDMQAAADDSKEALKRDPDNVDALVYRAGALCFAGQDASAETQQLLHTDPLNPLGHIVHTWNPMNQGRFDEAAKAAQRWNDAHSDHPVSLLMWGEALARTGRPKEAADVFDRLANLPAQSTFGPVARFLAHALRGNQDEALRAGSPERLAGAELDPEFSWDVATGFALVGRPGKALEYLEHAANGGFINYPLFSTLDPLLENLRRHEGFERLMEEVKARWERFEV